MEARTETMLHEFLWHNRLELIARCRAKVALRPAPEARSEELEHGITLFLDQLIKTLRVEQTAQPLLSRQVSGPSGGANAILSEVGEAAAQHGRELLHHGFTVDQVVHDYGDLCQALTELAAELDTPIAIDEFHTLNRCLDNAIAGAVTGFNYQRDIGVADHQAHALNERLGFFAHELRNLLQTATLALSVIKTGHVGLSGATGDILDRSMVGMSNLIDRSLTEVRMAAEVPAQLQLFSLAGFIEEIKVSASLEAQTKKCGFMVFTVDPQLAVNADRELLPAAVGNLLQNAFKFTRPSTQVTLNAHSQAGRILIDIEDQGEGLAPDEIEQMFLPFTQSGEDRSGLGLGLSIARRSIEANHGFLSARNAPESGCVFTISLPLYIMPTPTMASSPFTP